MDRNVLEEHNLFWDEESSNFLNYKTSVTSV